MKRLGQKKKKSAEEKRNRALRLLGCLDNIEFPPKPVKKKTMGDCPLAFFQHARQSAQTRVADATRRVQLEAIFRHPCLIVAGWSQRERGALLPDSALIS